MQIKNQAKLFFYLLLAAIFYATYLLAQPYLGVVFFALILVVTFYPMHNRIEERLGKYSAWATPLTTIAMVLILLIPLTVLLLLALNEIIFMIDDIIYFEIISDSNIDNLITQVNNFLGQYQFLTRYQFTREQINTALQNSLGSFATTARSMIVSIGGNTTALITKTIVFFALLSTLFPSLPTLLEYLKQLSPLDDDLDQKYIDRIISMSRDMFRGIVVIALVQGVAAGILFFAVGVPYVILWTILATLLSLVPIGTALVFVPAGIVLLAIGWIPEGIIVLLVGTLIIGNLDTVLRPRLVSSDTTIDSTLILIGALGGIALFGLLGVIYGPVLIIIFLTTLEIYRDHYQPSLIGTEVTIEPTAQIAQNDQPILPQSDPTVDSE